MENSPVFPKSIFLEKEFRMHLFSKAYKKAGSLRGIALEMGYITRLGLNGTARDMWLGKRGIPRHRVEFLLKFVDIPIETFTKNIVTKENNMEILDWMKAYQDYKK